MCQLRVIDDQVAQLFDSISLAGVSIANDVIECFLVEIGLALADGVHEQLVHRFYDGSPVLFELLLDRLFAVAVVEVLFALEEGLAIHSFNYLTPNYSSDLSGALTTRDWEGSRRGGN